MQELHMIGANIKKAREKQSLSQRELSSMTCISITQISAYENGKQKPGLDTLACLAKALDTSLDTLYYGVPSEAFLNESENLGETLVNCFLKLRQLGVVSEVLCAEDGGSMTIIHKHASELASTGIARRVSAWEDGLMDGICGFACVCDDWVDNICDFACN